MGWQVQRDGRGPPAICGALKEKLVRGELSSFSWLSLRNPRTPGEMCGAGAGGADGGWGTAGEADPGETLHVTRTHRSSYSTPLPALPSSLDLEPG